MGALVLGDDFAAVAGDEGTEGVDVDTLAEKRCVAIGEREMDPARMWAGKLESLLRVVRAC